MIKIGQNLGNFFIKSEIGKGGMGTIFFAVDTMLNREVALKVIHPQLTNNSQLMERFKIEAMTQARMNHPNIVMIFTFNKIEGEYIISMEYVDGRSLKQILSDRKVLLISEAIHYLKQILKGLHYAHSQNIIHRDIKPANIMVTKENEVKLSDFGIAKIFGTQGVTKTGMLIGTPWYTSPEQILGKNIDFRTDLYSAGITFYEMLTGRVPFDSETNSDFQIQRAHLETPPTRPSIYNSEVGIKVEKFTLKALQKNPDKRFRSAAEMLEELEKIEKTVTETTVARRTEVKTRLEKPPLLSRKRLFSPMKLISYSLLVLAAVAVYFVISKGRAIKKNEINDKDDKEIVTTIEKEDPVDPKENKDEDFNVEKEDIEPGKDFRFDPVIPDVIEDKKGEEEKKTDESDLEKVKPKKGDEIKEKGTDVKEKQVDKGKSLIVKPEKTTDEKEFLAEKNETADTKIQHKETVSDKKKVEQKEPEKTVDQKINVESELFKIRKFIQEKALKKAEKIGDVLIQKTDAPNAYSVIGSIKFFLSKYDEAETYWKNAIERGGEIKVRFYHKHGMFTKGCSGYIILKRNLIMYESLTRPEHSFVASRENVTKVVKPKRLFGIVFKYMLKGKKKEDTFILFYKRNRRKNEKFIADFINKYIMEE